MQQATCFHWLWKSLLCGLLVTTCAWSQPPVLELKLADRVEAGMPIVWNDRQVMVLRMDGSILSLDRSNVLAHRKTTEPFTAADPDRLRQLLSNEFGKEFDAKVGSHYVTVARREVSNIWAARFETIFSQFSHYFSVRGLAVDAPSFPMIAIVLRNQSEFQNYAARDQVPIADSTLGYYSTSTNRMVLWERPESSGDWFSTSTTILHEAAHQIAYNTGIHRRLTETPLWLVEGLASMFEAPGLMDARSRSLPQDCLNQARMATWKQMRRDPQRLTKLFDELIEGDELFQRDPDEAYAIGWAVSFYLSERDTNRYTQFLAYTASRRQAELYSSSQRNRDFKQQIAGETRLFVQNVDRYLMELDGAR